MFIVVGLFGLLTPLLFERPAAAQDVTQIARFHKAVQKGDVATLKVMLKDNPALATAADEYGFRPVHLLDVYFEEEILDLLLQNGAEINAGNDEGITLLHIVTDPEAVAVIVRKGGNIEARDRSGFTPLIVQVQNQQNGPGVVGALLASGADPNAKGKKGETALFFARERNDGELIRLLRKAGARD